MKLVAFSGFEGICCRMSNLSRFSVVTISLASLALGATASLEPYVGFSMTGEAGYEDLAGNPSVEKQSITAGVSSTTRVQAGQLAWNLDYSSTDVDWSGSLEPFDAFFAYDNVQSIGLSAMWTGMLDGPWSYTVMGSVQSAWADDSFLGGADFGDGIGYGFLGSVNYQLNPDLLVGFGLFYSRNTPATEENFFPIIQLYWKIDDNWALQTRNGAILIWSQDGQMLEELRFSVLWDSQAFNIGSDPVFDYAYEEEGLALGVEASFAIGEGLSLKASADYLIGREATIWYDGEELQSSDLEDTWRLGLALSYTF